MDTWIDEYEAGDSIPVIARRSDAPQSRVRMFLIRNGVAMRSRADGIRGSIPNRKPPPAHRMFTDDHKAKISEARRAWAEQNAAGISVKPSGYTEYTIGEEKGKSVHVLMMEDRIGRKLLPDEVVHHIDHDRSNDDINNLALMTRAAHTRLHRFEDDLAGNTKDRGENGRFS